MAEHLVSISGTEKGRVNCPFYLKIGACRHGDRCSRLHNRPTVSPTLLLCNLYQRPDTSDLDAGRIQEHFEDFYEDIFEELSKLGEIESVNVCDNLAVHMIGNVYVEFKEEERAAAALEALQGRLYCGRPIVAELCPVTDFREAKCRQFEENCCNRGGFCNFMHAKVIGRGLRRKLFGRSRWNRGSRSRSRSPPPPVCNYKRERENDGGEDGGGLQQAGQGSYESNGEKRKQKRSRSPVSVREGSEERRARIEQWNVEREGR